METYLDTLLVYKVKGYNLKLAHNFKVSIAALSYDEAFEIAEKLVDAGGWIISVKETSKRVYVKKEMMM